MKNYERPAPKEAKKAHSLLILFIPNQPFQCKENVLGDPSFWHGSAKPSSAAKKLPKFFPILAVLFGCAPAKNPVDMIGLQMACLRLGACQRAEHKSNNEGKLARHDRAKMDSNVITLPQRHEMTHERL